MKLGPIRLSIASIVLLAVQLLLVCSIAAKYLYQRSASPRAWTRTAAFDPQLPMRGRYLSLQLQVDGCQSTLPSAKHAAFPHNVDGTVSGPRYAVIGQDRIDLQASLKVQKNQLVAIGLKDADDPSSGEHVIAYPGSPCEQMRLAEPVNFYIAEHAHSPVPLAPGQELWIEVTVPPHGPPRPIQLALKQNGAWQPLAFQ